MHSICPKLVVRLRIVIISGKVNKARVIQRITWRTEGLGLSRVSTNELMDIFLSFVYLISLLPYLCPSTFRFGFEILR